MLDMEEHYDKIYRYCYFKLRHAWLAEDITQEVFLRYLECDSYKEIGRPLAFLYTVARNLCIDEYRKKQTEILPEDIEGDEDETRRMESLSLRMALEKLEEYERELILLRYVNEVPLADLSKIYGISRYAIYRRITSILKKLRKQLDD